MSERTYGGPANPEDFRGKVKIARCGMDPRRWLEFERGDIDVEDACDEIDRLLDRVEELEGALRSVRKWQQSRNEPRTVLYGIGKVVEGVLDA